MLNANCSLVNPGWTRSAAPAAVPSCAEPGSGSAPLVVVSEEEVVVVSDNTNLCKENALLLSWTAAASLSYSPSISSVLLLGWLLRRRDGHGQYAKEHQQRVQVDPTQPLNWLRTWPTIPPYTTTTTCLPNAHSKWSKTLLWKKVAEQGEQRKRQRVSRPGRNIFLNIIGYSEFQFRERKIIAWWF